MQLDVPDVKAVDLQPVLAQVRTALSRPVRMTLAPASWWLTRRQLAAILSLPHDGVSKLEIGGPGAERYLKRLGRGVNRPAQNAYFNVHESGGVTVVPAKLGRDADVPPHLRQHTVGRVLHEPTQHRRIGGEISVFLV